MVGFACLIVCGALFSLFACMFDFVIFRVFAGCVYVRWFLLVTSVDVIC